MPSSIQEQMSDLQIILDTADLKGIWGAQQPDLIVVGGYALNSTAGAALATRVREAKAAHGLDPDCPVKWNLKDIDLEMVGLKDSAGQLLAVAKEVRALRLGRDLLSERHSRILDEQAGSREHEG